MNGIHMHSIHKAVKKTFLLHAYFLQMACGPIYDSAGCAYPHTVTHCMDINNAADRSQLVAFWNSLQTPEKQALLNLKAEVGR